MFEENNYQITIFREDNELVARIFKEDDEVRAIVEDGYIVDIKKLDDDTPSLDLDGVAEVLERKIKNELL